ncbi:MAG TPA: Uma2 family endonuclease [Polyangia bacterium]|jgi:Uma2 family endonuclease|nr:Uma2 family endonuclease [Polyangia bacterium]
MAPVPRQRRATYADLEALPEHFIGEIIDGTLHASPRPAARHVYTASSLSQLLGGPFQLGRVGPGDWWIFNKPELHLGQDVLVPDLTGWRRKRMQEPPAAAYITLPPDWICEVLSPSTVRLDRGERLAVYARERVGHVWLLDPRERLLEVFRWSEAGLVLLAVHGKQPRVRVPPFDALELDLDLLWGAPKDAPPQGSAE